jgi:hypothetical protein
MDSVGQRQDKKPRLARFPLFLPDHEYTVHAFFAVSFSKWQRFRAKKGEFPFSFRREPNDGRFRGPELFLYIQARDWIIDNECVRHPTTLCYPQFNRYADLNSDFIG